ncbi:nitrogenase iron-molybdenum cofactor biosynthesis protein NifN [Seleniivibrio woodruffii]|uniref:Nitrogenase iron-molybdenum cofactor biosynthesis protein NifN n=1 Tax=Seleniivibrio woodruffii TaxID=1078050 RepID=A0A4R1KCC7_9BACT|nr:nitrogenase iron-molybdenum cofactor biosynthesis protein NifN [Seleniivibrio woodruffii]TCK62258.1 nitrogenase molybdenum-iron protein NifN [Seleniivibrio woodruffii]TVZ34624.1 nitrogenase molybdenum-cofactor synthesis protein NifE/nitrogenase molybdenum-iron protein NifN [Seleniivibrio woodruffii]
MVKIIDKPMAINPLKKSSLMGAVTAFLGMHRVMPLVHGAQGCMAFTKNFLTQHYREVTPMQSTAVFDIATIIGDDSNLHEGIKNVIDKQKPDFIGLVTTGMTEVRGDDIKGSLIRFREKYPEYASTPVVPVSCPDFKGDAETGYAAACAATLSQFITPEVRRDYKTRKMVNILAGMHLTAGDIDWLRRVFEAFGLDVIVFPDLSSSMGGQVNHFYGLPEEGTSADMIKNMAHADFSIVIGGSMEASADILLERCTVPYKKFDTLTGLEASDEFISWLMDYTGKQAPNWLRIQRQRAVDALLDGHFSFGGKTFSIAGEPDLIYGLGRFFTKELGIRLETAVTTARSGKFENLPAENIIMGDLDDLEEFSKDSDFIVASSNAIPMCHRVHKPLYKAGYPIKDYLGHFHRTFIGYYGAMQLAFDIGNICMTLDIEKSGH